MKAELISDSPDNLWSGQGKDPLFQWVRDEEGWAYAKGILSKYWREYQDLCPDRSGKFLEEFSSHIVGQAWQMILTVILKCQGNDVVKLPGKGPDIKIQRKETSIWIECIAPQMGKGQDRVVPFPNQSFVTSDNNGREISLRFHSALEEKRLKFSNYQKDTELGIASNDVKIIAVCAGNLAGGYLLDPVNFLVPFLYGSPNQPASKLKMKNGQTIESPFFQDNGHVDFVLYCTHKPWDLDEEAPNRFSDQRNIFLYPNPLLKARFPDPPFYLPQSVYYDPISRS